MSQTNRTKRKVARATNHRHLLEHDNEHTRSQTRPQKQKRPITVALLRRMPAVSRLNLERFPFALDHSKRSSLLFESIFTRTGDSAGPGSALAKRLQRKFNPGDEY